MIPTHVLKVARYVLQHLSVLHEHDFVLVTLTRVSNLYFFSIISDISPFLRHGPNEASFHSARLISLSGIFATIMHGDSDFELGELPPDGFI